MTDEHVSGEEVAQLQAEIEELRARLNRLEALTQADAVVLGSTAPQEAPAQQPRSWTPKVIKGGLYGAGVLAFLGWVGRHRREFAAALVAAVAAVAAAVFWFRPGDEQPGAPLGPMPTATVTIAGPTVISTLPPTSMSPSPTPPAVTSTPTIATVAPTEGATVVPTVGSTAIVERTVRPTTTVTVSPTVSPPATATTPTTAPPTTPTARPCVRVRLHPIKAVVCIPSSLR